MRALFYVDWCSVRSTLVRYLGICLIIVFPIAAMVNQDASTAPGVMAGSMFTAMMLFYVMLNLFSSDEQGDWEQMRMALPITPRLAVRERYAFLVLVGFAIAAVGTAAGVLANVILSALAHLSVPRGVFDVMGGAFGAAVIALGYLALVMPYVFKVGMSKARVTFSMPFVLCLLLNVGPVRDALTGIVDGLERMEAAIGSPAPIFAAIGLVVAAIYVASLFVSERIYAKRDF